MKAKRLTLLSIMLITALVLAGLSSTAALAAGNAQEEVEEVEITGTILSIDEEAGVFVVEVETEEGTEEYTIVVGEEFDFSTIEVGDEVEIEGQPTDEENTLKLTKYQLQEQEQEEEQEREREEEGYFCDPETEEQHPVAASIAETYETDYETVMGWFCGQEGEESEDGEAEDGSRRTGFGNIMLALHTAEITDYSVEEIMGMREEDKGWGQIWQDTVEGFGKPEDAGPPEDKGKPEDAGKPENPGKPEDTGKPEDVGKPDDVGPPEGVGKPPHAGPKK